MQNHVWMDYMHPGEIKYIIGSWKTLRCINNNDENAINPTGLRD